jgi:hypothetical protein
VGEDRGSKEKDRCPLTQSSVCEARLEACQRLRGCQCDGSGWEGAFQDGEIQEGLHDDDPQCG